ncbi:MAG: hypothetical protein ACREQ2_18800 [Candidatus Binatia bacterium]
MIRAGLLCVLVAVCACVTSVPQARFDIQAVGADSLWIPAVRNSTDADLRLPGTNPLRSLAEMAGTISLAERVTVMTVLRESLRRELEQRTVRVRFPEEHDARFSVLPLGHEAAARVAREGGLEGALLLSEIRRWDADGPGLVRLWVEFKLVRIADAGLLWERRVQKVFPAGRSGNPAEIHSDAVREIAKELF